jgi:6-phosphogluconolactonase (cycloisomerase 2 family)
VVAGIWPATAGAQSIPVPAGCVIDTQQVPAQGQPPGADTCASSASGLDGVVQTVVSPDGKWLYSMGTKTVSTFRRDPTTAALTFVGCIEDDDVAPDKRRCAETGEGLAFAQGIVMAPDGSSVYVFSGGLRGIVHFQRDALSGQLTRISCIADDRSIGDDDTCPVEAPGLGSPDDIVISPDGRFVYASSRLDGAITWFSRDAVTGELTYVDCLEDGADGFNHGCRFAFDGLASMPAMAMSPDGQMVFAATSSEDILVGFSRDENTGRLRPVTCIRDPGQLDEPYCQHKGKGAYNVEDIAVSPDGRYVYTSGASQIWQLEYDPATQLLKPVDCIKDAPDLTGLCKDSAPSMYGVRDITLSNDGAYLFGVSPHVTNGDPAEDGLVVFERDADDGRLAPASCIDDNGNHTSGSPSGTDTCDLTVDGLEGAWGVTISPDDSSIYVAAPVSDAIAIFGAPPNPGELTITDWPSARTNERQPHFAFEHSLGATVQCSLDQGVASFGPCTDAGGHTAPTPLADGAYVFRVRTVATSSVPATTRIRRFVVDTVEPQTTTLDEPNRTVRSFNLGFAVGSPEPSARFECRLLNQGTAWQFPCRTSYRLPDGTYQLEARAIDLAGNRDSSPLTLTATVDGSGPFVRLDSAPYHRTTDTTPTFHFTLGTEVTSYECWLEREDVDDDSDWGPCTAPDTYSVSSPLPHGRYSFSIRASDSVNGGRNTVTSLDFLVEPEEPWAEIRGTPPTLTNDPTPTFVFTAGGDSLTCSITGAGAEPAGPCSDPAGHTPGASLSDGTHTFTVRAEGPSGPAATDSHTFVVDTSAPGTSIDAAPAAEVDSQQSTFQFSGTGGAATFQCSLQAQGQAPGWSACSSPTTVSHPAEGSYRFSVRAIDAAGNIDPTPAQHDFVVRHPVDPGPPSDPNPPVEDPPVENPPLSEPTPTVDDPDEVPLVDPATLAEPDVVAPETTIERAPRRKGADRTPMITFSTTEGSDGMTFECSLDRSEFAACNSPLTLRPKLAPGWHRFIVRATDAAGNTDPNPATARFRVKPKRL